MNTTTLSQKYQVVIPREVREHMRLEEGDQVIVRSIDNDMAVILKRPTSLTDALSGLGKDMWRELGGADEYIKRERSSWDKSKQ